MLHIKFISIPGGSCHSIATHAQSSFFGRSPQQICSWNNRYGAIRVKMRVFQQPSLVPNHSLLNSISKDKWGPTGTMTPFTTTCIKPIILKNKQLGKELSGLGSPGRVFLGWSIVQYDISTTDVLRFGQMNVFLIWTSKKEVAEIHHLKPFGFVNLGHFGIWFWCPKTHFQTYAPWK